MLAEFCWESWTRSSFFQGSPINSPIKVGRKNRLISYQKDSLVIKASIASYRAIHREKNTGNQWGVRVGNWKKEIKIIFPLSAGQKKISLLYSHILCWECEGNLCNRTTRPISKLITHVINSAVNYIHSFHDLIKKPHGRKSSWLELGSQNFLFKK